MFLQWDEWTANESRNQNRILVNNQTLTWLHFRDASMFYALRWWETLSVSDWFCQQFFQNHWNWVRKNNRVLIIVAFENFARFIPHLIAIIVWHSYFFSFHTSQDEQLVYSKKFLKDKWVYSHRILF